MPRKPRFYMPGIPVHIVQRGNNRDPIYFDEADYRQLSRPHVRQTRSAPKSFFKDFSS